MQPLKPGYQTSEFWGMLAAQIVAAVCLYAHVAPADQQDLQDAIAAAVPAVAALLGSAYTVGHYIRSRTEVKSRHLDANAFGNPPPPPRGNGAALKIGAGLLALIALPGLAEAQAPAPPAHQAACLPWRRLMEQQMQQRQQQPQPQAAPAPQTDTALLALLQQLMQQTADLQKMVAALQAKGAAPASPAPAAPQFYQYAPAPQQQLPYQIIPIGPAPLQQIPIGPAPQQLIPIGPAPLQQIPIGPAPQQLVPIGPAPQQLIPIGPAPQQPLGQAPGTAKPAPQAMPPASGTGIVPAGPPTGYRRYSVWPPARAAH